MEPGWEKGKWRGWVEGRGMEKGLSHGEAWFSAVLLSSSVCQRSSLDHGEGVPQRLHVTVRNWFLPHGLYPEPRGSVTPSPH